MLGTDGTESVTDSSKMSRKARKLSEADRESEKSSPASKDAASPAEAESSDSASEGEVSSSDEEPGNNGDAPPVSKEAPPLPSEPVPGSAAQQAEKEVDDGWDFHWDATRGAYFFYNRFTGKTQWDNPRVTVAGASSGMGLTAGAPGTAAAVSSGGAVVAGAPPPLPENERPVAGGYNPAIHGDYDPEAWYAKGVEEASGDKGDEGLEPDLPDPSLLYEAGATFNRFTGRFQPASGDVGPERHGDEAKSRRQMNAFFDVDAAANAHDGRSLRAERANKKPSKAEVKAFKEKRRAKKEEKRRAWLRD